MESMVHLSIKMTSLDLGLTFWHSNHQQQPKSISFFCYFSFLHLCDSIYFFSVLCCSFLPHLCIIILIEDLINRRIFLFLRLFFFSRLFLYISFSTFLFSYNVLYLKWKTKQSERRCVFSLEIF